MRISDINKDDAKAITIALASELTISCNIYSPKTNSLSLFCPYLSEAKAITESNTIAGISVKPTLTKKMTIIQYLSWWISNHHFPPTKDQK